MQLALILGNATATVKHPSFNGQKLLVVQPLLADGVSPDGDPLVTIDVIGAGKGERVMITSDGKYVREWSKDESTPIRWAVIGTQDS